MVSIDKYIFQLLQLQFITSYFEYAMNKLISYPADFNYITVF
jgi:hypothetical protein